SVGWVVSLHPPLINTINKKGGFRSTHPTLAPGLAHDNKNRGQITFYEKGILFRMEKISLCQ
ncbi:MAG: hypothetical protein DRQ49_19725, partial [Gammaproteobacteria bacterium]